MASREAKLFGRNRTEIVGDREARALLKALGADVRRKILVPAMQQAMEPMLRRAKVEVAVESGKLKGALVEKTKGQTKGRILVDVAISGIPYAGHVEYGTKYRIADHALQRTFDAEKATAISTVERLIDAGIAGALK